MQITLGLREVSCPIGSFPWEGAGNQWEGGLSPDTCLPFLPQGREAGPGPTQDHPQLS